LFGTDGRTGGIAVGWQTASGDNLQIVANFADHELAMPKLIPGETMWRSRTPHSEALLPADILVRVGCES